VCEKAAYIDGQRLRLVAHERAREGAADFGVIPPDLLAQARPVDQALLNRESVVVVREDEAGVGLFQLAGIGLGTAARLAPLAAASTAAASAATTARRRATAATTTASRYTLL